MSHAGQQSLCLTGVPGESGALDTAEALILAEEILAEMQAARSEWLVHRPAAEVDRALLNARIVVQCLRMRADPQTRVRDAAMAENVVWLAEQHPKARLVLWAHNYHVSRAPDAMGRYLADRFGDAYLPVAFATAQGRYYAKGYDDQREHELQAPPDGSFEAAFAATSAPLFVLDLRLARPGDEGAGWLCETRPFRSIGALAADMQFFLTPLRAHYDLVVFVEETAPARQLVTPLVQSP